MRRMSARAAERRRRRRRILAVAAPLVLLTHALWLPFLAAPLKARPATEPNRRADYVCLIPYGGDRQFDLAAQWVAAGECRRVLILGQPQGRLQRYGVLPSLDAQFAQAMQDRGTPPDLIQILPWSPRGDAGLSDEQRLLRYLQVHPQAVVRVCAGEFNSRCLMWRLDLAARQVDLTICRDRRFHPGDWWLAREGVKAVLYGYFDLLWFALQGETPPPEETWDERAYLKELRQRRKESP